MNKNTLAPILLSGLLLTACNGLENSVIEDTQKLQKGPKTAPTRNITNFSSALRCMDNMLYTHGVEKFSVLAEDLKDNTKKINAGTRDMLITAVSDMTKRSRVINLVVFGNDSGNLISYLSQAGQQNVYNKVPKFDIRGSVTQLDKDIVSQNANAGISIPEVGFGLASSASGSILGLDMSIVDTNDMSLVPGVTSRNSIIIVNSGTGGDADGTIKKAGINFGINFAKTESKTQALRNLIELATVELFGKLLKLPYWTCLGIDPKHESIAQEIDDWYFSLKANNELVAYAQTQLYKRGFYTGPVDGKTSAEYEKAVALYRLSINLPSSARIDKQLFSKMLNTALPMEAATRVVKRSTPKPQQSNQDTSAAKTPATTETKTQASAPNAAATDVAIATPPKDQAVNSEPAPDAPDAVYIREVNPASQIQPGQTLSLVIRSNRDAHLYCFFQDDKKLIQRIYPNRFSGTSFVRAGQDVILPGSMPFQVTASTNGDVETLSCFTTKQEVLADLPTPIKVLDFVNLDVDNLDTIRQSFQMVAGDTLSEGNYDIRIR